MVYHYCNVGTFLNIIKNHTLRMSDIFKSTDNLEAKAILDSVQNRIYDMYVKDGGFASSPIYGMDKDNAFKYILEKVMKNIRADSERLYYVACFSEKYDLLGQWREYADKSRGIAIGFDEKWFIELCKTANDMFRFEKVQYEHKDKNVDEIIQDRAELIYSGILKDIDSFNTQALLKSQFKVSYDIVLAKRMLYEDSIFVKRKEFEIEQEWRLVLDDEIEKIRDDWEYYYNWKNEECNSQDLIHRIFPNALEFMERNGKIVSYLDLKYDTMAEMPVKEIILGSDCKVDESDVYHLLGFHGYDVDNIKILRSELSYRCI